MKLRSQVEITGERSFIKPVGYYVSIASCSITGTLNSFKIAAYIFEKKLHILIRQKCLRSRVYAFWLSRRDFVSLPRFTTSRFYLHSFLNETILEWYLNFNSISRRERKESANINYSYGNLSSKVNYFWYVNRLGIYRKRLRSRVLVNQSSLPSNLLSSTNPITRRTNVSLLSANDSVCW